MAPPISCERTREIHHRTLAGVIGDLLYLACAAKKANNRRKIDDTAVAVWNHRLFPYPLAEQKECPNVDVHQLVPSIDGMINSGSAPRRARIVYQNIHSSELGD